MATIHKNHRILTNNYAEILYGCTTEELIDTLDQLGYTHIEEIHMYSSMSGDIRYTVEEFEEVGDIMFDKYKLMSEEEKDWYDNLFSKDIRVITLTILAQRHKVNNT